ncbi:hypothetical protein SDC9_03874 [bioreactor metagenome]|uniref:DUF2442 domain-containing protein n=1 Tax=bioreactor metagenome TaxID=1076179 RepID=A0A644SXB0_9ZZZZ|nr:DUF2442 domain-containing protein [Negativicutes bacterium]
MRILSVIPNDAQLITVHFDNNHSVIVNMKGKLQTARFSNLRNRELFMAANTDGKAILWAGGISIAISEIIEIISK